MNLRFFISVVLIVTSMGKAEAQVKTVFEQLVYVNAEWQNQPDVDPALKIAPALHLTEQQLVQLHLLKTEELLRARNVVHLSVAQQQSRLQHLAVLHQYILAGRFPQNNLHNARQPYFIDAADTYCAVGYLMKMSGEMEMAKQISSVQNYNYLIDIKHPRLMDWVSKTGLTFNELALIQPGYGGEWPAAIIEMHYNNVGQDENEYIEIHQSSGGLIGMRHCTRLLFIDHLGTLYKTLNYNEMDVISNFQFNYYLFPSNESFADSGKVVLMSNSDTLSVYTYNAAGISLRDRYYNNTRLFTTVESEATPVGSSLTFCGLYSTTWNTNILPSGIGAINPCTVWVTPVTLTSFDHSIVNNSVKLNWQTTSESNSDYFELQRSSDGIHFTAIANIKAAGYSSTTKNYTFTDVAPLYLNHYRLHKVDLDGKSAYSQIIFVKMKKASPFAIIQNQVRSNLQVEVNTNQSALGQFAIYDLMGRAVMKVNAKKGMQYINVAALGQGKYLISLNQQDGQVYTLRFEKL